MGPIGAQEMILIFILALLLFGPKKLPELGRMLGKGLTEFRRAKNELKATFESHLNELERETRLPAPSSTTNTNTDYSSSTYPYPYDDYGRYDNQSYSSESQESPASRETTPEVSTASATAAQDAEAHRDHSSSQTAAVAGTVPRSNGAKPVEPARTETQEEHSA